ncbi:MAG: ASKHA domain-containing protein [Firmicutes bacterium]|nr:ASKHA domain-containing protein [Bacillota bacterium]
MKKVTVVQNDIETILHCAENANLLDVLDGRVHADCGGRGTCGKCGVIINGKTALACQTVVKSDMTVVLPDTKKAQILTEGIKRKIVSDGEDGLGIAVDIGTTTVAAQLIQLFDGKVIKTISQLNRQKRFGADVMSRMQKGDKPLHKCIIEQLNEIIGLLGGGYDVKRMLIAGNTVMMHFVQGFDTSRLAVSPYAPYSAAMNAFPASHYGLEGEFEVITAPSIDGFVGADTVCAMLACSMDIKNETMLLVDIGTNGEIALKHNDKVICCSTAAGTAFEGAQIKHGIGCVEGAINTFSIDNGVHITTIGNKAPIGICGSGIIDCVAQMLKHDIIDDTGYLESDFKIADNIYITQPDIREIQLAKSAIRSGIDTLLAEAGIGCNDVDKVFLAGAMGSFINLDSAMQINLLPGELKEKTEVVGNAAVGGAIAMLLSAPVRDAAKKVAEETGHLDLSSNKIFQDAFIENMLF